MADAATDTDQKPWEMYAAQKPPWELYGQPPPESIDQEDQVLSPPPTPGVPGNVPPNPLSFSELFSGIRTPQDISKEIGGQVGKGLQREGAAIPAALADIGTLPVNTGENKFRNLEAVMSDQPVPYEQEMRRMPTAARIAESGIAGTLSTAPQMAAFAANPALGVAAFGTTPEGFDPKQAALAAVLPIVGKYTGAITEAIASKAGIASDLALKVFNKIGGAAGAAGLLGADQVNTILQLPKDQQKDAWIDAIGNIGSMAFLGTLGERHQLGGESNAIQKQSPGSVFQRQPEEAGAAGSERGRVEPGQQGQETAGAGQGAQPAESQVPLTPPPVRELDELGVESVGLEKQGTLTHADGIKYGLTQGADDVARIQAKYDAATKDQIAAFKSGDGAAAKAAFGRANFYGGALMGATRGEHPISGSNYSKFLEAHPEQAPQSYLDHLDAMNRRGEPMSALQQKVWDANRVVKKSPTPAPEQATPVQPVSDVEVIPPESKNLPYYPRNLEVIPQGIGKTSRWSVVDHDKGTIISTFGSKHLAEEHLANLKGQTITDISPAEKQSPTSESAAETTKNGPGETPAQSTEVVPNHGVVHDEETGEYHVVNQHDEVIEKHTDLSSARKAASIYNGFEKANAPKAETGQRVYKVNQNLDDIEQQKHLSAERAQGTPIELTDDENTTHPFGPNAMAWPDRENGRIMINKDTFNHFINQLPKSKWGTAIRSLVSEERIHMHTTDADALDYWNKLSPWEQAIANRRYSGGAKIKGMTDINRGHEAIRYRIQQLARMKPTEVAFAVGKEGWTLKALSVAEHVIRNVRSISSFMKGRESRAIIRRVQQNIEAAKAAISGKGAPPAALRGRGRPKVVPTPKEQEEFVLPGMESTRLAGSKIAASNVPGREGTALPATPEAVKSAGESNVTKAVPQRPNAVEMSRLGEEAIDKGLDTTLKGASQGKNVRLPNLKDFTEEMKKRWGALKPGEISDLWSGAVGKIINELPGEDLRLLGKSAFGGNAREILSDAEINERFNVEKKPGEKEADFKVRQDAAAKKATEFANSADYKLAREAKKKGGSIWNSPVPDAGEGAEIKAKYTALERDLEQKQAELLQRKAEAKDLKDEVDSYAEGDLKLNEMEDRLKDARTDVWDATKFAQDARRRIKELQPEYDRVIQKQKRRAWIASAIFRKMVKPEVPDSEGILSRKEIIPEDVRPSNDGKYSSYQDLTDLPQSKIAEALADKARRSSSDSATITRRLAVLRNKRTGEVSMVSAYDHPHGPDMVNDVRVLDPLSPLKTHERLEDILKNYQAIRSVFLDQPVRKFRQTFKDMAEYNGKFGDEVERIVQHVLDYSPSTVSEQEFAQEAGGRVSEGSGGSFQGPHRDLVSEPDEGAAQAAESVPITPAEERSLVDYVNQFGEPRSAEDVLRALHEMAVKRPNATVVTALRKISAGFQKHFPDYDVPAILKALSQAIYDKQIRPKALAAPDIGTAVQQIAQAGKDTGVQKAAGEVTWTAPVRTPQRGTPKPGDVTKPPEGTITKASSGLPPASFRPRSEERDWEFPVREGSKTGKQDFPDIPNYISKKDWQEVSKAIRDWQARVHDRKLDDSSIAIKLNDMAIQPEHDWDKTATFRGNGDVVLHQHPLDKEAIRRYFNRMEGSPYGRKALLDAEINDYIGRNSDTVDYFKNLKKELYPEDHTVVPDYRQPEFMFKRTPPAAFFNRTKLEEQRDSTMTHLGVVKDQVANMYKRAPTETHMTASIDGMDTIGNNMGEHAGWSVRMESSDDAKKIFGFKPNFRGKKEILEAAPALLAAKGIKVIYHYDNRALAEKSRLLREDPIFAGMVHNMRVMMDSGKANANDIHNAQKVLGTTIQSRLRETGFLHAKDARFLHDTAAKGNLDFLMKQLRDGSEKAERMKNRGNLWDRWRGERWLASNSRLMRTVEFAKAHWSNPELVNTARRARMEMDRQYDVERDNGYIFSHDPEYLPGRHRGDIWSPAGIIFGGKKVLGRQYRKAGVFDNQYHAASEGPYIPASLDMASMVSSRVRQGMRAVARRMWWDSLKELRDENGDPVAMNPKADGSAPLPNYHEFKAPGSTKIFINEAYVDLVHQLIDPSHVQNSLPLKALLNTQQFLKHTVLAGDVFHLGKITYYGLSLMGRKAAFVPGWAATVIREEDLGRALKANLISKETHDFLTGKVAFRIGDKASMISRARLSELYERSGLNTGQIQDAIYKDLAGQIPGFGTYNRFLFDRFTTGMMKSAALHEFDRLSKLDPNKDSRQIIQESAKALNFYFGSIGRQGWIRSATWRDVARMTLLAPQWLEGLVKKELQPLKLLTSPVQALTGRDTAFRGIARGMVSMLALTQVANLIIRGTPTWQNPEKDHKWDANLGGNLWLSPLAVFNELTSDIVRLNGTKDRAWDVLQQIGQNKLGFLGRLATVLATGKSPSGEYQTTTAGVLKTAAEQLIPIPISFGTVGQAIGHAVAPNLVSPVPPGQLAQKIYSTAGVKTHLALDPVQQMNQEAGKYRRDHGLIEPQIGYTDAPSYSRIRYQLKIGDEAAAARTMTELRKTHSDGEILDAMGQWARKPFTSQDQESMFVAQMDDQDRKVYWQAMQQKMDLVNTFFNWYNSHPR